MLRYFIRWAKTAFTHSLGLIDLWVGLITAALGIADHYWPQAQLMSSVWQIPVWVLMVVAAARLLIAPYWMWQEDRQKRLRLLAINESVEYVRIDADSIVALNPKFFGENAPPLQFSGIAQRTGKLTVCVDYTVRPSGEPESGKIRVRMPDIDVLKGTPVSLRLACRGADRRVYWDDPARNFGWGAGSVVRIRLVFCGPDGKEQRYYFIVMQCGDDPLLLREHELLGWIDAWEKEA